MGKGKRTLVITLVTNNIFDFFKYALTTFFALGDRKKSRLRMFKFCSLGLFHCAKYQSGYNLKSNFVLSRDILELCPLIICSRNVALQVTALYNMICESCLNKKLGWKGCLGNQPRSNLS